MATAKINIVASLATSTLDDDGKDHHSDLLGQNDDPFFMSDEFSSFVLD
jgi:hypothetical protein